MLSCASAADGERIGQPGLHETLLLEAREGGVDRADGDVVSRASLDFLADGYPVGVIAQAKQGEHDEELEFTEARAHA